MRENLGTLHEPSRHDLIVAPLQNHFRQRFRRRPIEHPAVCRGKYPAVAGTSKNILFRAIKYRAGVMRAQPAESKISIFRRPQQKAGTIVRGIRKNQRASHGNFPRPRHHFHRISDLAFPPVNRETAQRSERGAKSQPPAKSAASNTRIFSERLFREVQLWNSFIRFYLCSSVVIFPIAGEPPANQARCPNCRRVCKTRKIVSRPIIPTICPSEITGIWLMSSACMRSSTPSAGSSGVAAWMRSNGIITA